MNDMQRSASGGTRQPRAPSSVLRTCGPASRRVLWRKSSGGKFSLLQTIEIARNGKIYGVCSDGASIQVEIETSLEHAALEVSCRLRRRPPRGRGLVDRAGPAQTRPGSRRRQAVAPARPQRRIAQRGVAHAPPPGRCGATRSSRGARGRRQIGVARKWRRNGLKRLNPRPEMVWATKPRTHNIWYGG
jgi:hypothetical protein